MEGPSIVPMLVPTVVFFTAAVSMCLLWYCWWKRFARQHAQTRTTVMTTHQPQYSYHQPVANNLQPAYGGQPFLTGHCQQPYAPGPPPTYQDSSWFPAPYSQAAYDGGQMVFPLQAALPTDYTSPQTPYNPAYVESQTT